ncbi:uroporphyrinogen-III synthase [Asticcacaulis tiandongensis]|uniref:uroporphyrinogen-III synthase n=1 Tax=Asticcacaulis tiandongensis TaxID=2565365 RepID=UPI001126F51B|nr:uroporphyrinogen-III synthase [Asticcacaulis tiandongensis]
MMLYWISRTLPAAETTAEKLKARGYASLTDPVLVVEPIAAAVDVSDFTDIIFTSPNGVTAFCARHTIRALTVWAVGTATAEAARSAGFQHIHDANGDGGDLSRLIIKTGNPAGHYLYAGPETPARDIAGALAEAGFRFMQIPFYRTVARQPETALQRLGDISHVLIHSPRAATLIGQALMDKPLSNTLRVICISEAAALNFAKGLQRSLDLSTGNISGLGIHIDIADHPSETSMLERIGL